MLFFCFDPKIIGRDEKTGHGVTWVEKYWSKSVIHSKSYYLLSLLVT